MQCLLVRHDKMQSHVAAQTPAQLTTQCHFQVHLSHLIHAGRCCRPINEQLLPPGSVSAGAKVASSALGGGLRLHDIMMEDAATGTLLFKKFLASALRHSFLSFER